MADLDDTDRRLLALLRANARLPVANLAAELGISRTTVQTRMSRLTERGIILGYTVRLAAEASKGSVRAITTIALEGGSAEGVLQALKGFAEIRRIHSTNGRWDLVAELEAPSLAAFDHALAAIRRIKGVANTETSLLLHTH